MILSAIRIDDASPLPDGDAMLRAVLAVRPGSLREPADGAPPLEPVRAGAGDETSAPAVAVSARPPAARRRAGALAPMAAVLSTLLHGAALAAFLALTTPSLPQIDLPAVDIEIVEPQAEPPPAAAAPAAEPEAVPQASPEPEPPPIDVPLPELMAELPAELMPPELSPPAPPIVVEPPPDLALPAELTPPPRVPAATPRPQAARPLPRQEPRQERRPEPRRQQDTRRTERPARTPPQRQAAAPSAASQGRGVTASQSQRSATPPPSYLARVIAQLHRAKPAGTGQHGRAVVRFSITRSGAATGVALASSSGNSAIDQAASAMVRRAAPFPPLPAEFGPSVMSLTVPINFR